METHSTLKSIFKRLVHLDRVVFSFVCVTKLGTLYPLHVLNLLRSIYSVKWLGWLSALLELLLRIGFAVFTFVVDVPGSAYPYRTFRAYYDLFECGYPVPVAWNPDSCSGIGKEYFSISRGLDGLVMIGLVLQLACFVPMCCFLLWRLAKDYTSGKLVD